MKGETPRVCIACGTMLGANRTNEHIIAAWLLSELGITEEELTQMIADSISREAKQARGPHVMDSFKEGRVCGKCNNGWMSQMESQTKMVLSPIINGTGLVTSISEADALIIARWTLKTAVVLSHAIALEQPLPPAHLQFLRDHPAELPTQVGVFATIATRARDFSFFQRNYWVNAVEAGTVTKPDFTFMDREAYKVSFNLKHLLLMAAYMPRASSHFLLAAGVHVPIWPNSILPCRRIELTSDPLSNPVQVLSAFSDSLAALHRFA